MRHSFGTLRTGALVAAFAFLAGAGCVLQAINPAPRPNVFIERSTKTIALQGLSSIPNNITIPLKYGPGIDVVGWRSAIQSGFRASFHGAFRIVDKPEFPDLLLEIVEVSPVAVVTDASDAWSTEIELRFKVRLIPRSGTARPLAGTVTSRRSLVYGATEAVSSALEVMYESIAESLFARKAAANRATNLP